MGRRSFTPTLGVALVCATLIGSASAQAPAGACPPAQAQPTTPAPTQPAPQSVVACIGSMSLTGATVAHWSSVARKSSASSGKHSHPDQQVILTQVMDFLISSDWVLGEAQNLGIVVSEAKIRHTFDKIRDQQFPKRREFDKFLRESGQTVADLLLRVRLNLLSVLIQKQVTAGHRSKASQKQALNGFLHEFKTRWQAQTYCEPAYAVADCGHVQSSL